MVVGNIKHVREINEDIDLSTVPL